MNNQRYSSEFKDEVVRQAIEWVSFHPSPWNSNKIRNERGSKFVSTLIVPISQQPQNH